MNNYNYMLGSLSLPDKITIGKQGERCTNRFKNSLVWLYSFWVALLQTRKGSFVENSRIRFRFGFTFNFNICMLMPCCYRYCNFRSAHLVVSCHIETACWIRSLESLNPQHLNYHLPTHFQPTPTTLTFTFLTWLFLLHSIQFRLRWDWSGMKPFIKPFWYSMIRALIYLPFKRSTSHRVIATVPLHSVTATTSSLA